MEQNTTSMVQEKIEQYINMTQKQKRVMVSFHPSTLRNTTGYVWIAPFHWMTGKTKADFFPSVLPAAYNPYMDHLDPVVFQIYWKYKLPPRNANQDKLFLLNPKLQYLRMRKSSKSSAPLSSVLSQQVPFPGICIFDYIKDFWLLPLYHCF